MAVPDPYVWNASFKTDYAQIDNEHKGLFKGLFDVAANASNAATLKSMQRVFREHFNNEQGIMRNANYAGLAEHVKIHEGFLAKSDAFAVPVSGGDIDFAKKWLCDHITTIDFKYKGKL